jgi:hypothetical protein
MCKLGKIKNIFEEEWVLIHVNAIIVSGLYFGTIYIWWVHESVDQVWITILNVFAFT